MKKDTETIPEITTTNTKKEIFDAYTKLVEMYESKAQQELDPEKIKETKRTTENVQIADNLAKSGLIPGINSLKQEIAKMLTDLSEKLENETDKYKKIKDAIEIKNTELKELYEIEKNAHSLAALINAQNEKKLQFEANMKLQKQQFDCEMTEKNEKLQNEIEETRKQWKIEQKQHEVSVKERDTELKKLREREQEEYLYEFNRQKQLSLNTLNDEKETAAKLLTEQKVKQEQAFTTIKANLDERQKVIAEKEKTVTESEQKVAGHAKELENTVNKSVKEVTDRLNKDKQNEIQLLTKDFEGKQNVFVSKIESLQNTVTEQKAQIEHLSAQLAAAYEKIQGIALKTVEGASHNKMFNDVKKLLSDKQSND